MTEKVNKIIAWLLTGILGLLVGASGIFKISGAEAALTGFASWGLSSQMLIIIGAIQLISISLFVVPRTALIGSLLQIAYFGGAIATHLEHGQSILMPVIIEILFVISLFIRFPEFRQRLSQNSKK